MHFFLTGYVAYEGDDSTSVPVILWLNGGPGCSSLDGLVYEHGPFRINATDPTKLYRFDETWAKVGHMLYLESPLGVGYSYSNAKADYNVDDDQTAAQNLAAVEKFFALFPELGARDFFITGESYAGVYVPTLAEAILNATESGTYTGAPLKGMAAGNGCTGTEIGTCGPLRFCGTLFQIERTAALHAQVWPGFSFLRSTCALQFRWAAPALRHTLPARDGVHS